MALRSLPLFPEKGRHRAYTPRKPPSPKEFDTHLAVADCLRSHALPEWRWTHFPAGEERDDRQAAKLKAMGLQRGWSDFVLVSPEGRFHALELKRQGGSMSGEQEAFAGWCERQGIPFACNGRSAGGGGDPVEVGCAEDQGVQLR